jgi:dGTPase
LFSSFATLPENCRGRLYKENDTPYRTAFQRDRDRIIHSTAFRRLEYKTQVFVNHEGDHYRTRLTHSLEVAQIARSTSRVLGLCEELAEALALAHDLGHPPFGHAGEDALNEVMLEFGGFDHNAHSIKLLTELEQKYARFDGLNLTWETIEGIAKHNGPLTGPHSTHKKKLSSVIIEYNQKQDLELDKFSSMEAQIAALADDIAYNNHDIEDGIRAGLITLDELCTVPIIKKMFDLVNKELEGIELKRLIHEMNRKLMNSMIYDLITYTKSNIEKYKIVTPEDVRNLGKPIVEFSEKMTTQNLELKAFLMKNLYRHYKLNRMTSKARRIIKDLFELFFNDPSCLPSLWREKAGDPRSHQTAIIVSDFIAGMTDRFAIKEHKSLFGITSNM